MLSVDDARVVGRSMRQIAEAPCSRRARAAARPSVPAPPVRTAFPSMLKRWAARSVADSEDRVRRGAVSGLEAVESVICGMVLEANAARSSSGVSGAAGPRSPIVMVSQ